MKQDQWKKECAALAKAAEAGGDTGFNEALGALKDRLQKDGLTAVQTAALGGKLKAASNFKDFTARAEALGHLALSEADKPKAAAKAPEKKD